eukprot:NODE_382_length_1817_cov_80.052602_g321_i0.p1 GENE.NODE_382_length_1817_cov_80.052602_g321_i0~~NODE_382_length_1817_cov_80.052602_g321_i0.p1  ORF type:complete len:581 (-),score=138.14 NODE_382_length_1817_cov_80.052602_g321_i0:75-1631(-)
MKVYEFINVGTITDNIVNITRPVFWPGALKDKPEALANVASHTFKIIAPVEQPYVMEANGTYSGVMFDIFVRVAAGLKMKYVFQPTPSNCSWNCLIEKTHQGEYDIMIGAMADIPERAKHTFTSILTMEGFRVVVRQEDIKTTFYDLFLPLTLGSWLLAIGVAVLSSVMWQILESGVDDMLLGTLHGGNLSLRGNFTLVGIGGGIMSMSQRSFSHGTQLAINACKSWYHGLAGFMGAHTWEPRSAAGRIFAVGFLWCAVVVVASYTANLSAFLSRTEYAYVVNGLDDILKGEVQASQVARASGGVNDIWWNDYAKGSNDTSAVSKSNELVLMLKNKTKDVILITQGLYTTVQSDCSITARGKLVGGYGAAWVLSRASPYKAEIDNMLIELQQKGTIKRVMERWIEPVCEPPVKLIELDVYRCGSALVVFLVFTGLSIIAHFALSYIRRMNASKQPPPTPSVTTNTELAELASVCESQVRALEEAEALIQKLQLSDSTSQSSGRDSTTSSSKGAEYESK